MQELPGARVLYLSYDGMCDPLGAAQVLPYLFGLARRGHRIDLISFEKAERSEEERTAVSRACDEAGIRWHPLRYHKRPPVLSSMYDVFRMHRLAARLHRTERFDLLHCRSYLPALVGLRMRRRLGIPFIFDMRGFWADERVDGKIWNLANPFFRRVFHYFKRREADFLRESGHVISLTQEGKRILEADRTGSAGPPITVIPCCVDFDAFAPANQQQRAESRTKLGIDNTAPVAAYLGSWGSWYLTVEMLDFFKVQLEHDPRAKLMIVSREPQDRILADAAASGVAAESVIVRGASRHEIPTLLAAADYGLFFIMPVFSKKGSSPTKMGELLAVQLPVVTNGGVGDVEQIVEESGAGVIVEGFDPKAFGGALTRLDSLRPDMDRWRSVARQWFDLDTGVERYDSIYSALAGQAVGSQKAVG